MTPSTAQSIATIAHTGQVDKSGHDYITHPARVADRVAQLLGPRHPAVSVAWLHDVLEDTDVTPDELLDAGISPAQLEAVVALTHADHEAQRDYLTRVASSDLALVVKLADMADNTDPPRLALLDEKTRTRLEAKYEAAHQTLAELTGIPELRHGNEQLLARLVQP